MKDKPKKFKNIQKVFCCKKGKKQKWHNTVKKYINKNISVEVILNKLKELEMFKKILFKEDQLKLMNTLVCCYFDFNHEKNNEIDQADDVNKELDILRSRGNDIDKKLLDIFNESKLKSHKC